MPFSLIPTYVCGSIRDIDWPALAGRGVRLVLADLDNTLIPYSASQPTEELRRWKAELEGLGMTLFVLSNSRKSRRCPEFCRALDVPYLRHAGKPSPKGFRQAMAGQGVTAEQTVMVGDQLFTDALGANRAGVPVYLARPIEFGNPFRLLRYAVELPFRALAGKGEGR